MKARIDVSKFDDAVAVVEWVGEGVLTMVVTVVTVDDNIDEPLSMPLSPTPPSTSLMSIRSLLA